MDKMFVCFFTLYVHGFSFEIFYNYIVCYQRIEFLSLFDCQIDGRYVSCIILNKTLLREYCTYELDKLKLVGLNLL